MVFIQGLRLLDSWRSLLEQHTHIASGVPSSCAARQPEVATANVCWSRMLSFAALGCNCSCALTGSGHACDRKKVNQRSGQRKA